MAEYCGVQSSLVSGSSFDSRQSRFFGKSDAKGESRDGVREELRPLENIICSLTLVPGTGLLSFRRRPSKFKRFS